MTYEDPFAQPSVSPAPTASPAPLAVPAQAWMGTARVGIDNNGDIWQYQGTAGVVKVGTGAIPTIVMEK